MLVFLLVALGFAEPVYVQASLLNLRAEPEPESRIEAWVRIGTSVEVDDESGDWVHVSLTNRPDEHPVSGWVLGRYLDVDRPTRASIGKIDDPGERASRLAAFTGEVDDIVERTHLAMCDGRRAEYLGFFDTQGAFVDRAEWEAPRQELMDLSAVHWTMVDPTGSTRAIQGSPFVKPFQTDRWNEEGANPFAPGSCTGICDGPTHTILGPCDREGTLFVSRAARGIESRPMDADVRRSLGSVDPLASRRGPFVEAWSEHAWIVKNGRYEARIAVSHDASPIRTFAHVPGIGWLGVASMYRETVRGWILVNLSDRAFETWTIYSEGWGC